MHLAGKTYEEVYRSFRWEMPARFNIAQAICERHAARNPDAPALLYEQADGSLRTWTFGEVAAQAARCANVLAHLGVGRGIIVGIHLPQCPESLIAHVAIQKLGAIALPLFTLFGPDAVGYRLADSGARVLITTPAALERTADAVRAVDTVKHVITVSEPGASGANDFWSLLARAAPSAPTADTAAGRSGPPHLHLRHHRQPQGRAACPARAARPPARRDGAARFLPAGRRPVLDAGRLGLGRRPARRPVPLALPRRAGGRLGARQVRARVGLRLHGAARRAQHLHAADRAPPDASGAEPARPFRLCGALDRHGRREAGRGHDGVGARDLRPGAVRVLRPDRGQPGGRQLAASVPGARRLHGPRHSRAHRRGRRRERGTCCPRASPASSPCAGPTPSCSCNTGRSPRRRRRSSAATGACSATWR